MDWNLERFVLMAGGHLDKELKDHTHFQALGHSKGNLNGAFGHTTYPPRPPSRHRKNGGIRARTRCAHPQGSRRISQDSRDLDAVRGGIWSLPSTYSWLLTSNRSLSDFLAGTIHIIFGTCIKS